MNAPVRITTTVELSDEYDRDYTVDVVAEVTPATATADARLTLIEPRGLLPLSEYRCEEAAWLAYEDALVARDVAALREKVRAEDRAALAGICAGFGGGN